MSAAPPGYRPAPPPPAWADLPFFERDWPGIRARLAAEPRTVLPPGPQVFAALDAVPPEAARVVILGQDPYPTPGHAHGHAFSVAPGVALPRSLANIHAEMRDDLGACPADGDLRFWARQGVLLLNTALTVPAHAAGGHKNLGWARLVHDVLARLAGRPRAYLLWGRPAEAYAAAIGPEEAFVLCSAHPSPLSARRGFFGSRPFSRVNDWLMARGETPIDWAGRSGPGHDRHDP